jgi:hypothetical protein
MASNSIPRKEIFLQFMLMIILIFRFLANDRSR